MSTDLPGLMWWLVFDIRLADFEKHFNEFLCIDVNNKNSS